MQDRRGSRRRPPWLAVLVWSAVLVACGGPTASPTTVTSGGDVLSAIAEAAVPLTGDEGDYDALLERIGDARWVLIGEASHGTHEFYAERAAITRRLIAEKGFAAVVVEADWPHAYRVNRYVRGAGDDASADAALGGFAGFPDWMWRNRDVAEFVDWLRHHNAGKPADARAGFYGMDLYSLYESMDAVVRSLEAIDPGAASRARERYACFEDFADPERYGLAAAHSDEDSCRDEVIAQLRDVEAVADRAEGGGTLSEDDAFAAEQNARVATNAEAFYRALYAGRGSTWNLRDRHMAQTLEALSGHLARDGNPARLVVWAHNSHIGDARATSMADRGELNVGQLVREAHGLDAVAIGFSTYAGTVMAAHAWGGRGERREVVPALPDSYEALFHSAASTAAHDFLLDLRPGSRIARALGGERLQRAIGVIYRPETERWSHYFEADLPRQFDVLIHLDRTSAVEPLPPVPVEGERPAEMPATDLGRADVDQGRPGETRVTRRALRRGCRARPLGRP